MPLSVTDRLEILDLAARYNHAVDSGDSEGVAALFIEDGALDAVATGEIRGRPAIAGYIASRPDGWQRRRHFNSSPIIEGDGDRATLALYLLVLFGVSSLSNIDPLHTRFLFPSYVFIVLAAFVGWESLRARLPSAAWPSPFYLGLAALFAATGLRHAVFLGCLSRGWFCSPPPVSCVDSSHTDLPVRRGPRFVFCSSVGSC